MSRDLKRERQDYEAGPNGRNGLPHCYNLNQNVAVEISTMDSFAARTVIDNVAAMQGDVTTMRKERADFKRDINGFVNDGVARPRSEQRTVAAITGKIAAAVREANKLIKAIRAELHNAHLFADQLASRSCTAKTLGAAPTIPFVH